ELPRVRPPIARSSRRLVGKVGHAKNLSKNNFVFCGAITKLSRRRSDGTTVVPSRRRRDESRREFGTGSKVSLTRKRFAPLGRRVCSRQNDGGGRANQPPSAAWAGRPPISAKSGHREIGCRQTSRRTMRWLCASSWAMSGIE